MKATEALREPSFEEHLDRMTPPTAKTFLPWLLVAAGPAVQVVKGEPPLPWVAAAGLAAFAVLYAWTVVAAFGARTKGGPLPKRLLRVLTVLTFCLTVGYGPDWLLLFPLLSLAMGTVLRYRVLGLALTALSGTAGIVAGWRGDDFWDSLSIGYGTFISGMVTSAILSLFETVTRLRETRKELARAAVEEERLRFSRDLHDLLGHTLSVVVVKAEAVRRLAPRDLDAALGQAADIESVGRQALTEIREAVTGYRQADLATELDRARSALLAVGIEPHVRESGPALPPQTEALLGWVVREGVTNVVRHSRARRCDIELSGDGEVVRLEIRDDGRGASGPVGSGSGLRGLGERLAAAGGGLTAEPMDHGFRVEATLQVGGAE
ncbi:sensor histidine kinase [Wenjunlia tyrosinilytica]|uniref:Two-component sensor histidine kinase n=1 Tax=Wenjunlia tyrosinilytica TaxID=1544741 RepID=A0A917ZBD4_9ACTN|nr:histidine kinase [Wenjunlia tyrosinilytica]GGO80225.1 two-component sensor histidine kinase [Wenjunlia tyrosinilytica]